MVEQARSFAARLQQEADNDADRIARAFELAYGRPPEAVEVEVGLAYLNGDKAADSKLTLWQSYAQALLAANEFMYLD